MIVIKNQLEELWFEIEQDSSEQERVRQLEMVAEYEHELRHLRLKAIVEKEAKVKWDLQVASIPNPKRN